MVSCRAASVDAIVAKMNAMREKRFRLRVKRSVDRLAMATMRTESVRLVGELGRVA